MKYYYAIFTVAVIVVFHILKIGDMSILEWELVGVMGMLLFSLEEIRDEIRKGNQKDKHTETHECD